MKSARMNSRQTRTSAIADSWTYATALTRMYADQFDAWCAPVRSKKPLRVRARDESQGPGRKH
jgi:hypothetical protein